MADQEYREGLERAILGVLVWDAGAVVRSSARLRSADFVDPRHQLIFEACLRIQEAGRELDPTVVTLELTRAGQLAAAGGAEYLGSLHADPRTLEEHLRQLRAEITRLKIGGTLREVVAMAADRDQPIAEIMAETSRRMSEIEGDELLTELPPISEAVDEILYELEHGSDPGTTTGLLSLDKAIQGGIKAQQMVVLAGSTGSGKTALATLIALRAAEWAARDPERGHVLFFSYEMSRKELGVRMLLQTSPAIKDGYHPPNGFSERDKPTVRASLEAIRGLPLLIEERSGETVAAVRGAVERYIQREGRKPVLVVVDHIGLLSAPKVANRTEAVGQITRGLKTMARLLGVPVLAVAQLNREVGKREDHRPQLSDLRESGCLTGDARVFLPDEGGYRLIRDLVGCSGFRVLAIDTTSWQLEPREATSAFSTGRKPVFRLTTHLGRTIRATANHKFLAFDGWRRLDGLSVGEQIALPRLLPSPVEQTIPDARNDVDWDDVVSIEPDGDQEVYDVTVSGLHSFVADDVIVHNSIEQDANVVLLIYRESYYLRDPEERSQKEAEGAPVELYVAKNRSGPLTKVMLTWYGPHTTFSELNPETVLSGIGLAGMEASVIDDAAPGNPDTDPETDFAEGPPIDDEDMNALFA